MAEVIRGGPAANAVLTDDEIRIVLAAAAHAPSMHNTQPWRFEIHGPVIDVLLDEERTLPVADPAGRGARIGLGAAAFNVRVAAAMLGYESRLAVDPDPARPEVVARLFLADRQAPVAGLSTLYGEVSARHTYRGPLLGRLIPPRVQHQLDDAARQENAQLHWLDPATTQQLDALLKQTDSADSIDEDRLHERLHWIGGDRSGDGVHENALGPLPALPAVVRDLALGFDSAHRSQAVYERQPTIAVLSTAGEDGTAWVTAGLALQRMLLVATSYDLTASFLNQVLERPVPRFAVRELIGGHAWPQMVIRIGYPAQPAGHTSRLDWRDSLDRWF
ncbi:nitroreductase family protein [Kribbella sp. NBC_00709]|uniref:Acg family FMN-binding oxidoreductase n=1 Tax=Kribbella sp. NBC_00709 TaxID=2975972 RepID=UPI002E294120|nr:nitroreductase family protein [Kribbella sp. NBC_00709]